MRLVFNGPAVALLTWTLLLCPGASADPASPPSVVLIAPTNPGHARLLAPAEEALQSSKRFRLVLLAATATLMRQADDAAGIREKASLLVEEGRKAQLALQYDAAQEKLDMALGQLSRSFIRYYDPRELAQVHLLLGILALNKTRPDLARQQFVAALHLDPSLKPDAHFSPQVRAAFEEAALTLPAPPAPPPQDLQRIIALTGSKVILALGVQDVGEQSLINVAVFQDQKQSYTSVESVLVIPAEPVAIKRTIRQLGERLRLKVERLLPLPATRPAVVTVKKDKKPPPPPPAKPWYRRWYTWVAAGTVVATAIIVPLALREEHVGVDVNFPSLPKP